MDVQRDAASVVQIALVDPAVALDKLEYVLVITDYEGGIPIGPGPSTSPGVEGGGGAPSDSPEASPSASPGGLPIELPSPSLQPAP